MIILPTVSLQCLFFLFAVTVTMSNDYVQNFTTSFGNLRSSSKFFTCLSFNHNTRLHFQSCLPFVTPFVWNLWRITTPEQQGLHMWPRICIATVLTQNIRRILLSVEDLEELHNLRRDSLADSVVCQRIVALVQLRVRDSTFGVYPWLSPKT